MNDLLKPGSNQEPLALLYRNGEAATSGHLTVPRFSDICLTKESQDLCDGIVERAKKFDHRIQSEAQCEAYIDLHTGVDKILREVRQLAANDRAPFTKILTQISTALEPVQTQLISISEALKRRITEWRAEVAEGQRREQERLEAQAEEKRNEAKYTDDPQKSRKAKVLAKQLEQAAKEIAPKPEKGVDTVFYWVGSINNRMLAAKLPEKIVQMSVDDTELDRHLKSLERAGEKITPNILPGLSIERKTRVRFHR
jgi:type I site-specific restriction-modification system R (restriction) subunit